MIISKTDVSVDDNVTSSIAVPISSVIGIDFSIELLRCLLVFLL